MARTYRTQIVQQPVSTDPSRDYVTNVVWHNAATATPTTHGDAILALFMACPYIYQFAFNLWVKVYDHANPLHSPPVYTAHHSAGTEPALGPRQVALCLSYFSGLNIKGQRGRIYCGPWGATLLGEYASTAEMNAILAIGSGLKNVGASDTVHVIHHPKTDTWSNVSNYFVNNRWDTMRSRLPKETNRVTA